MAATTYSNQFEAELRKRLNEEREDRLEVLGSGAPEDYAQYREGVGYLRALKDMHDWCEEVRIELDKR